MAQALGAAAKLFLVPAHLGMMLLGVLAGLVVGVLPGMGGIVAVAVLLPFVVRLDAIAAPALLGLVLGAVGPSPAAAQIRFSFGQIYLMDGLDLAIVALGIFGIAETIGILARGGAIAERVDLGHGWMQGIRDVIEHRWLVLRGSLIGMWAGVLPAIGATAGTWMAYGHVVATSKERSRFGKGDIPAITAPEAANNAGEAGDLVPTLLFSVPGTAPAAMIMGALLAYGIVPGPRIVQQHLDIIYAIVWTFAAANIIRAAIMFLASPTLARLTYIPSPRLAPPVILMMVLAAFQETQHFGDILALLLLGVVGYMLKATGWPRAPLLIGFVLANPLERYFWLTVNLYPDPRTWLLRPAVLVIGALLVSPFVWTAIQALRRRGVRAARAAAVRWRPGLATGGGGGGGGAPRARSVPGPCATWRALPSTPC